MTADIQNPEGVVWLETALEQFGVKPLARVRTRSQCLDIAFRARDGADMVARCVEIATPADITDLSQMLREGPFTKAILISSSADSHASAGGVIQTKPEQVGSVLGHLL